MALEKAGAQWCARFPTSKKTIDLASPFREDVEQFIEALRAAGATVTVSATYRPVERAYLMHWCGMVANSGQDPQAIPPMDGVNIDWTCGGDRAAAKKAAAAMMAGYNIAYPAALVSRHTQRRAVDMTIALPDGGIAVKGRDGKTVKVTGQTGLVPVGKTFGVIKLASDPPHWSDDGH